MPTYTDCFDPAYWNACIDTANTANGGITAAYTPLTKLDLSGLNSSINITPNNITLMYGKEQKEYIEKLEKHIDELEEDIDFLDKARKNMDDELAFHVEKIGEFTAKINHLEDENALLHGELNNLHGLIYALQQRLDNQ